MQATHDLLKVELKKWEKQKRLHIKKFVDQIREQLKDQWDLLMKSDQERARFIHINNDCYTEELLTLHEMELKYLKDFYEQNQ